MVAVDENVSADFVVVPHVAWRILKIPVRAAAFGIQGNGTVGIKIVARPIGGIKLGRRVPRSPEGLVGIGIVGPSDPDGATARLPSVVRAFPGLAARLAGSGNRVLTPQHLVGR